MFFIYPVLSPNAVVFCLLPELYLLSLLASGRYFSKPSAAFTNSSSLKMSVIFCLLFSTNWTHSSALLFSLCICQWLSSTLFLLTWIVGILHMNISVYCPYVSNYSNVKLPLCVHFMRFLNFRVFFFLTCRSDTQSSEKLKNLLGLKLGGELKGNIHF